jgi:hypothetical protein
VTSLLAVGDPSEGTRVRRFGCWIAAVALVAIGTGCNEGGLKTASRTLTATVTLSLEDTLAIDSAVALVVEGQGRINEIYATLEATVTASTSSRAEELASRLSIQVQRRERTVSILIPVRMDTVLTGKLSLRVPSDLKIDALARGATNDITGMDEEIRVMALSHTKIVGAKQDVIVGVARGNALVSADLDPGSSVELVTENGDIQLTMPQNVSTDLSALVRSNGVVIPNHPQLPPYRGNPGQTYHVRIGEALSTVSLETGVGNIAIGAR